MSKPRLTFLNNSNQPYPAWSMSLLKDAVEINPKTDSLPNQFIYIDLESVQSGTLISTKIYEKQDAPSRAQRLLKAHDVLFQMVRPYQKNNYFFELEGSLPAVSSTGYAQLRATENCPKFIYYTLHTNKFVRSVLDRCTGGAYPAINSSDLGRIVINIPCKEEQQKIAAFFSELDEKIRISNKKINATERLRESLMRQIFDQRLKVKRHGVWKDVRFLDLVDSIVDFRGRTPKKLGMEWGCVKNEYLALSALNVKNDGIDESRLDLHYGTKELYEKWMSGKQLHKGQVLLTTEAPAGNVTQVPDDRPYILSQRLIAFNVKKNLVREDFLAFLLKSPNVQQNLFTLLSGGTAKGVSQRSLAALRVTCPASLEEQKDIADIFFNIDLKIELQKKMLEKLKMMKVSFMQQMFA